MVASHARARPPLHGTKVIPSGRLAEPITIPEGSFDTGVPAETIALDMMSFMAKCLVILPAALLQTIAWVPHTSTGAPHDSWEQQSQTHWGTGPVKHLAR